jgi:hypothetical protein
MEQLLNVDMGALRFQHPFNCIISGASGSGKTTLLVQILSGRDETVSVVFDRIVYCYGEFLPSTFAQLRALGLKVELVNGLPTDENILPFDPSKNNCLILDDLMQETCESRNICNYFTRTAHHKNISIFYLTQNFYQKGRFSTSITRNSSYIILFSSPNDVGQIRTFASQRFNPQGIMDAYNLISRMPRGYLLIDCTQNTPYKLRLRTNIIPPEEPIIFEPKLKNH